MSRPPRIEEDGTAEDGEMPQSMQEALASAVQPTELGAGQLAGTIADATHAEARMIVNLDQVRGSITLTGAAEAPQVVSSLESSQPVSIVTRLHEDGLVEVLVIDDATEKVLQRGNLRIGSGH